MSVGRKAIDLTGKTFGWLTVIGRAANQGSHALWNCTCICGNTTTQAQGTDLRRGRVVSCGCLRDEKRMFRNLAKQHHATR